MYSPKYYENIIFAPNSVRKPLLIRCKSGKVSQISFKQNYLGLGCSGGSVEPYQHPKNFQKGILIFEFLMF